MNLNLFLSPKFRLLILCLAATIGSAVLINGQQKAQQKPPLKALLIAGGCCHDYTGQHKALFKGIQARANVQVDVWWTDDKSVNPPLTIFEKDDWAEGYDVVIHDECAAGEKNLEVMKRILDVHKTVPAVHLHCAMHSFRNGTDQWFKHLGLQSTRHGPQEPIEVKYVDKKHPIVEPLEDWTTGKEELYNNAQVFDAHPLAMGTQKYSRNGEEKTDVAVVAWVNEKQGARSFSTSLGHNTFTVEDERYLDLVVRGMLWTMDKLNDDYVGVAYEGENEITFVKGKPKPQKKPAPAAAVNLGKAPKDATLVSVTASSVQGGRDPWMAVDGRQDTRWCASGGSKPQWIQFEFEMPQMLTGASIKWEREGDAYQYKIETSADGKSWAVVADETGNEKKGETGIAFAGKAEVARFVKITTTNVVGGGWVSAWEIQLKGPEIKKLWPKLDEKQAAALKKEAEKANDPLAKEGNIPPKIVKLTPEEEAEILKDVKVPEGFDVSVFSSWQAANYPVYVAAAPNGDLYVSSDGNGSLGREPHRGR
ncbi:MAG: heme-binding protein, partial [Verrucomicrobiales bacterium]|nr:heme-binding protein [Verrucomicrobiales bacterium]